MPFCSNAPIQFTPLLKLRPLIFCLTLLAGLFPLIHMIFLMETPLLIYACFIYAHFFIGSKISPSCNGKAVVYCSNTNRICARLCYSNKGIVY
jgi:hypothetical protein